MTHSMFVNSVIKGASAIILGVMAIAGIGAVNSAQAARCAGSDVVVGTTGSPETKMQFACHRDPVTGRMVNCPPTCGVRGKTPDLEQPISCSDASARIGSRIV